MTDFGRPAGGGDMLKSVYDTDLSGLVDTVQTLPSHADDHQNAGADEISVDGLSGDLADLQTAKIHTLAGGRHTASTLALLNLKVSDATLDTSSATRTPSAHKTSHQNGGTDKIDASGLDGRINWVDRGDPDAFDFRETDFDTDGNWHELDFTGKVAAGSKAVIFFLQIQDNEVGKYAQFKNNANSNNHNIISLRIQVANITFENQFILPLDSNLKLAYRLSTPTFTYCDLLVQGWII